MSAILRSLVLWLEARVITKQDHARNKHSHHSSNYSDNGAALSLSLWLCVYEYEKLWLTGV